MYAGLVRSDNFSVLISFASRFLRWFAALLAKWRQMLILSESVHRLTNKYKQHVDEEQAQQDRETHQTCSTVLDSILHVCFVFSSLLFPAHGFGKKKKSMRVKLKCAFALLANRGGGSPCVEDARKPTLFSACNNFWPKPRVVVLYQRASC